MKYLIIGRNESNSVFKTKVIHDNCFNRFKFWLNDKESVSVKSEGVIIHQIYRGDEFYTKGKNGYAKIEVVNDNIRSEANGEKDDNISNLPIRIL